MRTLLALTVALAVCTPVPAHAQEDDYAFTGPPTRSLLVRVGLGILYPADQGGQAVPGNGSGFFGGVEYVVWPSSWFSPRVYGGVLLAPSSSGCGVSPCDITARSVLGGAKVRVRIPIPVVAPLIEAGLGLQAGQWTTRVGGYVSQKKSGVVLDIPVGLGVALGSRRQFELMFVGFVPPALAQSTAVFGVGMQFPLE